MALTKKVNLFGMDFDDAYLVITRVEYDKGLNLPTDPSTRDGDSYLDVLIYAKKSARDSDDKPLGMERIFFDMDVSSDNGAVQQAYAHLKTLDEYLDATDV